VQILLANGIPSIIILLCFSSKKKKHYESFILFVVSERSKTKRFYECMQQNRSQLKMLDKRILGGAWAFERDLHLLS